MSGATEKPAMVGFWPTLQTNQAGNPEVASAVPDPCGASGTCWLEIEMIRNYFIKKQTLHHNYTNEYTI